ncbi:assembly factor cbp4 [Phialemonium atrogriseum]|uniref:Cytochrome b mRNA-processing protein 4 n=1 Tax=Phialemonium atrogriseum TaxID=1093897 RepID=A0AAJ0BSL2_9PEZI|nr:assembly factor cbp4 [Phialemonium atrogriseum]KAK1763525.1 assembly factor cbp4 [Phialemonium atrogriseum]
MAGRKGVNWWLYSKMLLGGGVICVGGPAFTWYLTPTDEELFQRYSPELKQKSLERRYEREKEFDDFVNKLKEYSKSDKSIWVVQAEEEQKAREARFKESLKAAEEVKARKEEMRRQAGLSPEPKR